MDVIYCAGGNRRLATIAIEEGFLYGSRSDDIRRTPRCDGIIDVAWRDYDWDRHLAAVELHRPRYAVVPDVLYTRDLPQAVDRARQLGELGALAIVVPKVHGIVRDIPSSIIVGVSVPTPYAGFLPDIDEIKGRSLHLLGGSPRQQRSLWVRYSRTAEVVSLDVNCHALASDFGSYWDGSKWCDSERTNGIGKYMAFRRSCRGILDMWSRLGAV